MLLVCLIHRHQLPPHLPGSSRALLRRYPEFPDVRAALAAALWEAGLRGEAETEWQRLDDGRYRDLAWVRRNRRWPPRLVADLQALLAIKGVE